MIMILILGYFFYVFYVLISRNGKDFKGMWNYLRVVILSSQSPHEAFFNLSTTKFATCKDDKFNYDKLRLIFFFQGYLTKMSL